MEHVDFLPLGSIVIVQGGIKKLMIVSRAVAVNIDGKQKFFDYGACAYPEGIIGDKAMYFNHEQIFKVINEGYTDDDNELVLESIKMWMGKNEIERGNPEELLKQTEISGG
jgi:hypothetical protein